MSLLVRAAIAAVVLAAVLAGISTWNSHEQAIGAERERAVWGARESQMKDAALAEAKRKAQEGQRRLEIQQRNQDAQDAELAAARAAAARNAADADRVRQQAASAAREWSERLADSPSGEDLAAAGAALRVCTDLLGRSDARASLLASVADARRAAGLKCERDYDALTTQKVKP